MNHYRFTESQDEKGNPIGTLEKQVTEGGQTSWQEDLKGYIPYDKEAEKDKEHDIAIADINSKIPEEASEENKLTDSQQVSEDIATSSATFRETYNLVSDLSLTTSATREQVAAALGTTISEADNNDFCYVEVPTADATPTEIARTDRYKFNGTAWAFEFSLPGFTAAEWAAIESGITAQLVEKLINLATVATSGSYDDLENKPSIPDAQIQSDWNQSDDSKKDYIKNKPAIPVVPSNVSAFNNDVGYLTQHQDISGKVSIGTSSDSKTDKTYYGLRKIIGQILGGDDYVDLALPSGTLWAKKNIGADNPEDTGYYFSWGNVEGHAKGSGYDFSSTNYDNSDGALLESDIPISDAYDMARKNNGIPAMLPTVDQLQELIDNCNTTWTAVNGVNGMIFTSKNNGNSIFLPAAGYYDGTNLYNEGTSGVYWTNGYSSETAASCLTMNSGGKVKTTYSRKNGLCVRPVM